MSEKSTDAQMLKKWMGFMSEIASYEHMLVGMKRKT